MINFCDDCVYGKLSVSQYPCNKCWPELGAPMYVRIEDDDHKK